MKKTPPPNTVPMARFTLLVSEKKVAQPHDDHSDTDSMLLSCSSATDLESVVRSAIAGAASDAVDARRRLALRDVRIDIASFVASVQSMHGGSLSSFLEFAEIDRNTHRKLISAADDAQGDRTMLETLSPILRKSASTLVLTLNSCIPGQAALIFRYSGENSRAFCANFFRQCRAVTGLSKKQLDEKLGKVGSGYSSKVETGRNKKGVSIATLIEVAVVCGFEPNMSAILPKVLSPAGGVE